MNDIEQIQQFAVGAVTIAAKRQYFNRYFGSLISQITAES